MTLNALNNILEHNMNTEVFTMTSPFNAKKTISYLTDEGLALRMDVDIQIFREWIEQVQQPESSEGKKFRQFILKHYGEEARREIFEYNEEDSPTTTDDLLEWVEWEVDNVLEGGPLCTRSIGQFDTVFYGPTSCPKIVRYWAESGKSAEAQSWIDLMLIAGFGEVTH